MAAISGTKDIAPASAANPKTAEDNGLSTWGMLLAAIGGGIGVLSFVAFFGAAILWVRFRSSGLPANDAVAVVPKSVLITTGASFLVPSLLVALAFVAVLYLIETATVWWSTRTLRELESELKEREGIAEARQEEAVEARRKAEETAKIALATQETAAQAATAPIDDTIAQEAAQVAQNAFRSATNLQREAGPEERAAAQELKRVKKEVEKKRLTGRAGIESTRHYLRWIPTGAAFVIGAVATILMFSIQIPAGGFVILIILLPALCFVCLAILASTDSFAWFALAVVVAVGILSGFLTYYRTKADPKVEPAAVLRTHGPPVYGFYVAQTNDRVYLGTGRTPDARKLDAIPREEVRSLMVGGLQPPAEAGENALILARELCHRARLRESTGQIVGDKGGGKVGEEVAAGCTSDDAVRLGDP